MLFLPLNFIFKNFPLSLKFSELHVSYYVDVRKNDCQFSCKSLCYCCSILTKLGMGLLLPNIIFHKIPLGGSRVVPEIQTTGRAILIDAGQGM
jgi:hypothetical protein